MSSWPPLVIEDCPPDERYLKRGTPRLICQGITSLRHHAHQFAEGIFEHGDVDLGESLADTAVDYVVARTGMDRAGASSIIFGEMAAIVREMTVQAILARANEIRRSRSGRRRRRR